MTKDCSFSAEEVDEWQHSATFKHMEKLYELQKRVDGFRQDVVAQIVGTKKDLHKIHQRVRARKESPEKGCQNKTFSKYELMLVLNGVDRSHARRLRKLRRSLVLILWEMERETTGADHRIAIRLAKPTPAFVQLMPAGGKEQLELLGSSR
jgi:hypothetical protein